MSTPNGVIIDNGDRTFAEVILKKSQDIEGKKEQKQGGEKRYFINVASNKVTGERHWILKLKSELICCQLCAVP